MTAWGPIMTVRTYRFTKPFWKIFGAISASLLYGCDASIQTDTASYNPNPFVGCWQSEDGLATEGWTQDASGWLFGYAVNRNQDNKVTFFEHMRMDSAHLFVTGPNDDTVRFKRVASNTGIIFENPAHDYPQRIAYFPAPGRLDAEISSLDGGRKVEFKKRACHP